MCHADDIALLASSPSALHHMLSICSDFAVAHNLLFNPEKTQLIKFTRHVSSSCEAALLLVKLKESVTHLGHIVT